MRRPEHKVFPDNPGGAIQSSESVWAQQGMSAVEGLALQVCSEQMLSSILSSFSLDSADSVP